MKQTKYYCDICKSENPDWEDKWHSQELKKYQQILSILNLDHAHLTCIKIFKVKLDNILPENKK